MQWTSEKNSHTLRRKARPELFLGVVMTAWIATLIDFPWNMIAAFVALATFLIILHREVIQSRKLRKETEFIEKLKEEPCIVHFLIPDREGQKLDYVEQNEAEHLVDQLVLPSNSELPIELWIKPKINFQESELYFGFEGTLHEKPRAVKYFNPFVIEDAVREASPKENPQHYVRLCENYRKRVNSKADLFCPQSWRIDFSHSLTLGIPPSLVRANLFGVDNYNRMIMIRELTFNMDREEELTISVPIGHGSTGRCFQSKKPNIAVFRGGWGKNQIEDEELRKVHPDLQWIISVPILAGDEEEHPIWVLNVDGLQERREEKDVQSVLGRLLTWSQTIALIIAKRIEQLRRSQ